MNEVLKINNIEKYYGNKGNIVKAIDDISFTVKKGEFFNFEKDVQHSVIAKKDTKMLVVRI